MLLETQLFFSQSICGCVHCCNRKATQGSISCAYPTEGEPWEVLRFKGESEKCAVRAEKVAWRLSQPHEDLSERL